MLAIFHIANVFLSGNKYILSYLCVNKIIMIDLAFFFTDMDANMKPLSFNYTVHSMSLELEL